MNRLRGCVPRATTVRGGGSRRRRARAASGVRFCTRCRSATGVRGTVLIHHTR